MSSSTRTIVMSVFLGSVTPGTVYEARAAGPVSDDFNVCAVNTSVWTVEDPIGSSSVSAAGMGTENAQVVISIPAGASHDVWTTYNDTVRLMQAADNTDFEVRVKYDSLLTTGYQMQGILVEQDAGRFLRLDLVHDGANTFLFSATFASGSAVIRGNRYVTNGAPFHLSVKRTGDQWTLRYSYDGTNWLSFTSFSFAMNVARVGPFAGNWSTGTAPAVTVKVDYFLNVAFPFAREDGPADVDLTLATSVTGQGTISVNPIKPTYNCGEQVTVTAVPATGWKFTSWSGDLSGTSPSQTFSMVTSRAIHATFVEDATPPLSISNVAVVPNQAGAVITWNTSNAANSLLRYGTTTSYELGQLTNAAFLTSHSATLTGLAGNTPYHYSITCADQDNQTATTPDATFTTTSAPPAGNLTSDDFNAFALNTQLWTIVNPTNLATFRTVGTNTANARLEIALPAGTHHEAWTNGIVAPWVKQNVPNTDFGVEAKFDSTIDKRWQVQGLIVQEDADSYLRIDFYADNAIPYIYVASFDDGTVRAYANRAVPAGAPYYLRVTRAGNQWTASYSKTGQSWTTAASFNFPMTVTAVGPYIANEGTPAPAFTGLVDYVFNTASPITAEDGQQNTDTVPPVISAIQTVPQPTSISVSWTTDEPADSLVFYGKTTSYELGSKSDAALTTSHTINITGMQPNTNYNLKISSADASGNESQSGNLAVKTTSDSTGGPTIDIWYGDTQQFGHIGTPIPMVNILGKAYSSSGVSSLAYSLNGGAFQPLSMGPNSLRLAQAGDFNVEILLTNLQPGNNAVQIRARDPLGRETLRTVTVVNSSGPVWPNPYTVNWSGVSNINSVAQVVDGIWSVSGSAVRPLVMAYDRLIAVGDRSWEQYEVSCPITVHAIDPHGYDAPSYGPGVGLLLRWPGHSNDGHQPWEGVYPLGAIGMFRWTTSYQRFQLFGNNGSILASSTSETLQIGVTYIFKMHVHNVGNNSEYRFKWWRSGQSEPSTWQLTGTQSKTSDPGKGSILLLAHHVDASFGAVTITKP